MRFSDFDTRHYRTVDVRRGYGEWVQTYERTVQDAMDIELLASLTAVPWSSVREAVDLGCGTGRTGTWLRAHQVVAIDGVDLTPEMLERAAAKDVYRTLAVADVATTPFAAGAYDLVITCLVDEHLADLAPLYREASRLARPGAQFVLVGYHPQFIMVAGMPTHYDSATGEPIAIETHLHPISEHVTTAHEAGWTLAEMRERFIDDTWIALKPKWQRFRSHPISMAFVWRKA